MSESALPARPGRSTPRRGKRAAASAWNLTFASTASNVPVAILKDSPTLLVAAVEDLCWQLAVQDWARREPPRVRAEAHRAWEQEAPRFGEKRQRIQAMVREELMGT